MDVTSSSGQATALQQYYASIRAKSGYASTVQESVSWSKANPTMSTPLIGGKPTAPASFYSGDLPVFDSTSQGMAMQAYSAGSTVSDKPSDMNRFWNEATLSIKTMTSRASATFGAADYDSLLWSWRGQAQPFLEEFAKSHAEEYQATADSLGINISDFAYDAHFSTLSDGSLAWDKIDLSAGRAKSDAERIFFAMASPDDIAAFQSQMSAQQQQLDTVFNTAADQTAANLQRAKDCKAAATEVRSALADLGVDNITLAQLQFRQDSNGGIAVSGHPDAQAIGDAINANPELSQLMSYVFGLAGQGTAA